MADALSSLEAPMKKLNLRVEDLAVESFRTAEADELRGTVRAHDESSWCSYDSPGYTGCRLSCMYDCGESGGCTGDCPGGGSGSGGTATQEASCNTGCKLSCAYPC
jgi:hypothetical protein